MDCITNSSSSPTLPLLSSPLPPYPHFPPPSSSSSISLSLSLLFLSNMERLLMDTFFIPHATKPPDPEATQSWPFLRNWKDVVGTPKPKSILIVSAHWDTSDPTVNVFLDDHNHLIYDFEDFAPFMYQINYPAPAAPQLAMRVKELLTESGFEPVHEVRARGLDHGAWIPLTLMYPEADIPVCEISVQSCRDGAHHFNMGKALSPLREEGVMIIGSGGATNNPDAFPKEREGPVLPWALEFTDWLKDSLLSGRYEDVIDFEKKGPHAKMAHPKGPDHMYPLLVALGAVAEKQGPKVELIHDSWNARCFSHAAYQFSNTL